MEAIIIKSGSTKEQVYEALLPQIKALVFGESDEIAVLANVAAALHQALGHWWTGFYIVKGDELVLGPFQGPVACSRIAFGKGVCGTAWQQRATILVPDVELFPGHIACSAASRSEIVVPLCAGSNGVHAVLDIDSTQLNAFDQIDQFYLEQLCNFLGETLR